MISEYKYPAGNILVITLEDKVLGTGIINDDNKTLIKIIKVDTTSILSRSFIKQIVVNPIKLIENVNNEKLKIQMNISLAGAFVRIENNISAGMNTLKQTKAIEN